MALIHNCYRITDIDRSVAFYNALGFEEIGRLPIRDEAINVFMNQPGDGDSPRLELTFNVSGAPPHTMAAAGGTARTRTPRDALAGVLEKRRQRACGPEREPYSVRDGG